MRVVLVLLVSCAWTGGAGAADDQAVIALMREQLDAVEAVSLRIQPHVVRLVYLHAAADDATAVLDATAGGIEVLVELQRRIAAMLESPQPHSAERALMLASLADMQSRVAYRLAWLRLDRAMALPADRKEAKTRLLADALAAAVKFIDSPDYCDLKYQALLLAGRSGRLAAQVADDPDAARRLRHDAAEHLARAGGADSPPEVRAEAKFEAARELIERGEYAAAGDAIESLRRSGSPANGDGPTEGELKAALLRAYIYRVQARDASSPSRAAELDRKAQRVLGEPGRRHPWRRGRYLRVVGRIFAGRGDIENLDSMILLAVAACEGEPRRREELLRAVLLREDEPPAEIHAEARWRLGELLSEQGRAAEAGECFSALARARPDSPRGFAAAVNAARQYAAAVEQSPDRTGRPCMKLRRGLIDALEILVASGQFAGRPDADAWYYQLGYHCLQMARTVETCGRAKWVDKAIAALGSVRPGSPRYAEARYWSACLRIERIEQFGADSAGERTEDVIADLRAFAADAAAVNAGDQSPAARRFRRLGASAAKTAARLTVRGLLDAGRTGAAAEAAMRARADNVALDSGLLERLLIQIARHFDEAGDEETESVRLRRAYLALASDLFAALGDRPAAARYRATQLLADAHIRAAPVAETARETRRRYEEALRLFAACRGHEPQPGTHEAANLLGLARAHAGLGQHGEALRYYSQLIASVDRLEQPGAYWTAELEYCRCLLAAYRGQQSPLRALCVRIRQLRLLDPRMGGRGKDFDAVAARAAEPGDS